MAIGEACHDIVEDEGDAQIILHRERWTNELRLVYADGRRLKLTETPVAKEGEGDGERTPLHARPALIGASINLVRERAKTPDWHIDFFR